MFRATNRLSQPPPPLSPQGTGNVIPDENSVIMRRDTPSNTTAHTEVRIITTKTNIPDEYYGDKRKLKAFII